MHLLFTANEFAVNNKLTMSEAAAAQAFIFYSAGYETSATTATYCLYELACHQHLQDKVCKEIDKTLEEHGEFSYTALNEMTYLHKVINGNCGILVY